MTRTGAEKRSIAWDSPWVLLLGFLLLYLWRLSLMALWDNDETTYAEIAREIWQSGDWITMHFRGLPWFCHPPLYFWSVAVLDRVLGYTELAARLPSAVAGAGFVTVVYVWGRRMLSPRAALIGALCLGLNFQIYTESRMALLDTMLHLFSFWALLGLWDGTHGRPSGYRWMFVASGLACLAKGPFGLLFPWLVGLPYLLMTGGLGRLKSMPWLWLLVALLIGGTWYGVEIYRHGWPFFDTVLIYFAVKRMTIRVQGQGAPDWVYLAITATGLFPWSVYLPGSLWSLGRRFVKDRWDVAAMLLSCSVVPFVFFTVAETKLPNYIVFAYPGLALAIGWYLDTLLEAGRSRSLLVATGLAAGAAWAFVAGMGWWAAPRNPQYASAFPTGEAICGLLAAMLVVATVACWSRQKHGPVPAMALGMALFLALCSTLLAPLAEPFRPIKTLGMQARARLQPADQLVMFGLTGEYGLTFYSEHFVTAISSLSELRRVFNSPGKVMAVVSQSAYQSLAGTGGVTIHPIAVSGQAWLLSNHADEGVADPRR